MLIIGVCGHAGSGKDTIGEYLCKRYGFSQESLAAPIKRLVKDVFVLDDKTVYDRVEREKPLKDWNGWSVRKLLQYIGSELLRKNIDDRIWVKSLWRRIQNSPEPSKFVITDVRIPNERSFLKRRLKDKFVCIRVTRPGCDGVTSGGIKGHVTEAHVIKAEFVIKNDSTYDALYAKVDEAMTALDVKAIKKQLRWV